MFLWCVRNRWRDIYSERRLLPISSSRSQGVPTLAPPYKLIRDNLIGCVSHAWLRFSTFCLNLTIWFSSHGPLPVTRLFNLSTLIMLSCLLITTWQLVKTHGVTKNELKIHGICYITHIYVYIYIYTHIHTIHIYICVCVCVEREEGERHKDKDHRDRKSL